MSEEEQRLARLEAKVDSMQNEVTEIKNTFHRDFASHQEDDRRNFSKLAEGVHQNDLNVSKLQTRLNVWGAVIVVFIPLITVILKKVLI